MSVRILSFCVSLVLGFVMACSSPQSGNSGTDVKEPPKEAAPTCFEGCMISSANKCTTEGNVMDWSSSEAETIDCDPRCCEPGAKTVSGTSDPDGDGVYDDADQCPDKAEDRDGFQDDDGCPDADNDGDGILDDADLCPLDAEDIDGFQDDDGCPDI